MSIELSSNLSPNVKAYFLDTMAMSDDVTDPETLFNRPPLTYVECYETNKEMCRLTGLNILAFSTLQSMIGDYDYYTELEDHGAGLRLLIDYPTPFLKETLHELFSNSVFKDIYEIQEIAETHELPHHIYVEFAFVDHNSDLGHLVTFLQQGLEHPFFVDTNDGEEYDIQVGNNHQAYLSEQLEQRGAGE